MTEPVQKLDYAGAPSLRRRRIRRAVIAIVVFGVVLYAHRWGRRYWDQAALLYWQQQCMTYRPPADAVLFELDPSRAAALIKTQPADYAFATLPNGSVFLQPRCLRNFDSEIQGRQRMSMHISSKLGAIYGPVTIFLHRMRTPLGAERLVVVESESWNPPNLLDLRLALDYRVYEPAGIYSPPRRADPANLREYSGQYKPAEFGVGTADESNPSHLTIPYSYKGQSGAIDGWLENDEQIRFVVTHGPGK